MGSSVTLNDDERGTLLALIHQGKANGRARTRAQILLKLADGWAIDRIMEAYDVSRATVYNTRARYHEGGCELVMHDRHQQKRRRALTGDEEALLIAVTCSPVPGSHDHWTLRMLKEQLIELGVVERISPATIHAVLKKMNSSPGSTNPGV
jgi:transposase